MTDRLTDEDLARLEALEKAATIPEWRNDQEAFFAPIPFSFALWRAIGTMASNEDRALVVAARNALPALLAEVRASRAEIAGLRADLAMASGTIHAQDERERRAGERCGITYEQHGCDWPDAMAEEVLRLRAERDALVARASRLWKLVKEGT